MACISITPLSGIPEIAPGDDLASHLAGALQAMGEELAQRDILVVAQKIVSKAEGRFLDLNTLTPSPRALELAATTLHDPRWVEAVLAESAAVIRAAPHVLIVRHRLGYVMANAGIDRSNLPAAPGQERVLLLPHDPDASAMAVCRGIRRHCAVDVGVIISDSFGRAWRSGVTNVALGAAGVPALHDRRGEADLHGRRLEVTQVAFADLVAAAAGLVMGEGAEGIPAAVVRGLNWCAPARPGSALIRPLHEDLFQ